MSQIQSVSTGGGGGGALNTINLVAPIANNIDILNGGAVNVTTGAGSVSIGVKVDNVTIAVVGDKLTSLGGNYVLAPLVIDATVVASTMLFTTVAGFTFLPTSIIVSANNVSGVISQPTLSIGTNALTYDNIFIASPTDLTITGTMDLFFTGSGSATVAPLTPIFINISVGAVATNYLINVVVGGVYI